MRLETEPPAGALLPAAAAELPKGRDLVAAGMARGRGIQVVPSAFSRHTGFRGEAQLKAARAAAGELAWSMILGQASLDAQVDGLRYLDELGRRTGHVIDRAMAIPDWSSGLPPHLRERAPKGTSFVLDGLEDHLRIAQAAPMSPAFCDWHIGSPYCVENTVAAIAAGGSSHGVLAQFTWDMPLVEDEVAGIAENVTAIGVVAARRNEGLFVDSYMDDGMPGHFVDNVSLVGYALLEKYVVDDLCGARYATGFGGLISDLPTKIAVWLALAEVLAAEHPCLSYLYGNTLAPSDADIVQNFGVVATEMAVFAAVERRFRTGVTLLPNPITEKIQVPTPEEIGEARLVAGRAADHGAALDALLDWPAVAALKAVLVEQGRLFYRNALAVLAQSGVDVRDPVQVLLALRHVGAHRLEQLCHPAGPDPSQAGGVAPFLPTELLAMTHEMARAELAAIPDHAALQGRRCLVASADTHWFGAYAVRTALEALGAEVVDAGSECEPAELARLAAKARVDAVAVSAHNGQCLTYGTRLVELLRRNGPPCTVYVGGKLNAILPGADAPSDVTAQLRAAGIVPCATIADLVAHLGGTDRAQQ